MKTAICEIAKMTALSSTSKFKVGAVLFKKNKILSVGANSSIKTHPFTKRLSNDENQIYLHAELRVLLRTNNTKGASLLVVRIRRDNGMLTMAKPCSICIAACEEKQIRNIIYSDWKGNLKTQRIS